MITKVRITNYVGTKTEIILNKAYPENGLMITNIDGLGPSAANIAKQAYGIVNGSFISSVKFDEKNIVITFRLSESEGTVERARLNVYEACPQGTTVTLEVQTDLGYEYFIDGVVESIEPNIFSDKEEVKVSIICESPFFSRKKLKEHGPGEIKRLIQASPGLSGPVNKSGYNYYCVFEYIFWPSGVEQVNIDPTYPYIVVAFNHQSPMGNYKGVIGIDPNKLALLRPTRKYFNRGDKISFYSNPSTGEKQILYYDVLTHPSGAPDPSLADEITWKDPVDITSCESDYQYQQDATSHDTVLYGFISAGTKLPISTGCVLDFSGYYNLANGVSIIYYDSSIEDEESGDEYEEDPTYAFSDGSITLTNNGNIEGGGVWTSTFNTQIQLTTDSTMHFYDDKNHNIHVNLYKVLALYASAIGDVTLAKTIEANDILTLSTVDRNKYVRFKRNNVEILVLDACGTVDFDWTKIYPGENTLRIEGIDSAYYRCILTFDHMFGGI